MEFVGTTVNGRVDHGIGRVVTSTNPKQRFQSLLLIVEAKTTINLSRATPQLVVYLGSIHQSRLQRNRRDATVYGVVSDGLLYAFVTITHDGVLKQSRRFGILEGDLETILGCIKYLLEASANMSPNITPERGGDVWAEDSTKGDSDIDIEDTASGYSSQQE